MSKIQQDKNIEVVSFDMVGQFVSIVTELCKAKSFFGVYGFPRGGLPLAVWISHKAKLPLLMSPYRNALLVDDIADTGATLLRYKDTNYIATMYYHRQSLVKPDFWLVEKRDKWIVFPWER